MTFHSLERQLLKYEEPLEDPFLKWLYLHLPPQPIRSKKLHRRYASAISILLEAIESGAFSERQTFTLEAYLQAVIPFAEEFEKRKFPLGSAKPEAVLKFFMEQHRLSQYDLAKELGGQPVVSAILAGKRKLTRDHIEQLSHRFRTTPAAFYPG